MARAQLLPAQLERDLKHPVGEIGQVVGKSFYREQARKVLREQTKDLGVVRLAQPVHLPLLVALSRGELGPQLVPEAAPVRSREQRARVEQLVEDDRVPVEVLRR